MSTISSGVLIGVLSAVFAALLTYFISTLTGRGYTKKAINEGFKTHVKIHHKTDPAVMISSTELKLEGKFNKSIKEVKDSVNIKLSENHTSIVNAHQRIDETNKSVNEIALHVGEIKVGQAYIVKTLEKIEKGLG